MLRLHCYRFNNIIFPHSQCFAWKPVNQVNADVPETGSAQPVECVHSLLRRMTPVYDRKQIIIEALHAHTHTIERQGTECLHIFVAQIIGIGLYGYFRPVSNFEIIANAIKQTLQLPDFQA